jgi:hypothetical protein
MSMQSPTSIWWEGVISDFQAYACLAGWRYRV